MKEPEDAQRLEAYLPRELLTRFGETVDEAAYAARGAVARYIRTLATLDAETLSQPISPGKWSPIGFTDHLRKVTQIHIADIRLVMSGGRATRPVPGLIDDEGRLIVTVPGAEPGPELELASLAPALLAVTAELIESVRFTVENGHEGKIVHVNPYFGELTPIGCLQLCAAHAHHHRKRHLLPLGRAQREAPPSTQGEQ